MMLKARSLKYTQNVRILANSLSIKFHCVLLRTSSPQNKKQILVTSYNYSIHMFEALFQVEKYLANYTRDEFRNELTYSCSILR